MSIDLIQLALPSIVFLVFVFVSYYILFLMITNKEERQFIKKNPDFLRKSGIGAGPHGMVGVFSSYKIPPERKGLSKRLSRGFVTLGIVIIAIATIIIRLSGGGS